MRLKKDIYFHFLYQQNIPDVSHNHKQKRPTQRAPDGGDSPRLTSFLLTSGLYSPQAESRPVHLQLTPTVGRAVILFLAKVSRNRYFGDS